MNKNLLLIFTKNTVLGKCKTRLAESIGDEAALAVYHFLMEHTASVAQNAPADKHVYYSDEIVRDDAWDDDFFSKKKQHGIDLGERMKNAFAEGFAQGYQHIIIIGSDLYDLKQQDLETAFEELQHQEFVVGPALDGGYYLLGMNSLNETLFLNKKWSTDTVLADTLKDLKNKKLTLLDERNDIDEFEDIKDLKIFQQFFN